MARVTIDLSKGLFEIEGSEEFVEKRFTEFQPQLIDAIKFSPGLGQGNKDDLEELSDEKKTTKKTAPKRPKSAKKVEVSTAFADIDEVPIKLASGLTYGKLKKPQDQFLWTLGLARELNKDGLVADDIIWVTDNLGAGIASNHISVHFQRLRKKGYANQSTQTGKMRIIDDGIDYLNGLATGNGTPDD